MKTKIISVCFQKMQKPIFPILTPIRLKLLVLLEERKKNLAKITHVSLRTSNCGEIDIARFLHASAFDVFGKTCSSKSHSIQRVNNNKWFDESCQNGKRDFKSARNIFNRLKTDEARINFTRTRTRYNKLKRKPRKILKSKIASKSTI